MIPSHPFFFSPMFSSYVFCRFFCTSLFYIFLHYQSRLSSHCYFLPCFCLSTAQLFFHSVTPSFPLSSLSIFYLPIKHFCNAAIIGTRLTTLQLKLIWRIFYRSVSLISYTSAAVFTTYLSRRVFLVTRNNSDKINKMECVCVCAYFECVRCVFMHVDVCACMDVQ